LCGKADIYSQQICVPSTSKCPVRGVRFDDKQNLVLSYDVLDGAPVIDVKLSEGKPCYDFHEKFNTLGTKQNVSKFF
jgi:hypothetical protein